MITAACMFYLQVTKNAAVLSWLWAAGPRNMAKRRKPGNKIFTNTLVLYNTGAFASTWYLLILETVYDFTLAKEWLTMLRTRRLQHSPSAGHSMPSHGACAQCRAFCQFYIHRVFKSPCHSITQCMQDTPFGLGRVDQEHAKIHPAQFRQAVWAVFQALFKQETYNYKRLYKTLQMIW